MSTMIRSSLGLALLSSLTMFGMEKAKEYTVGMKIPNDTYAGQKVNPVHMTLTFLGAADAEKLAKATTLLTAINAMRPIKVKVGAADTFGTQEKPILVRRLAIESPEIAAQLIALHQELGVCEPGQPTKLAEPNYHVSVKDDKLRAEFITKEGTIIIGGKLFIKPLGKFDPVVELE